MTSCLDLGAHLELRKIRARTKTAHRRGFQSAGPLLEAVYANFSAGVASQKDLSRNPRLYICWSRLLKDDGLLTHLEQSSLWTFVRRNPTAGLAQVSMKAVPSIADGGSMLLDVLYAISLAIGLAFNASIAPTLYILVKSFLSQIGM